ncbi:MAG: Mur ligase domain-containing protein [Candidatus Magasanikbacteria bacterium]
MLHDQKHIHFIGICGVGMSALALALKEKGYAVTGSDKGFYPPVSTHLKDAGVSYYAGWHPEKMRLRSLSSATQVELKDPDLVVVGNVASSTNPEWIYVQEHTLNYVSYPELIKHFFLKKNSIVCAGTYGKSTSTAILAWILKENGFDPNYMFGGIPINDIPAAKLADSQWSVLEGDEYKTSRWDNGAKFLHYNPTHLLLTSVVWDHADVYPTEKSYVEAFETLVKNLPKKGLLVLSAKVVHDHGQFIKLPRCPIVTYGKTEDNDYQYTDVKQTMQGIEFKIKYKSLVFNLESSCLGDYMADNITGCFAIAQHIGIAPYNIIQSIATFKGVKRRLEKRYENSVTVFDDIAHSPKKAEAVLRSLRSVYSKKIIAIFEPNTGNRQHESIPGYDNRFTSADEVIIPRLTSLKQDPNKPAHIDGEQLAKVIQKTHVNVKYIEDDEKFLTYATKHTHEGDVIVFLGSHGFRGMIEGLIKKLSKNP